MLRIARSRLRQTLLAKVPSEYVEYGKTCISALPISQTGQPVQLAFSDGTEAECDLLVVADGANSKLRSSLMPHEQPRYAGICMLFVSLTMQSCHAPGWKTYDKINVICMMCIRSFKHSKFDLLRVDTSRLTRRWMHRTTCGHKKTPKVAWPSHGGLTNSYLHQFASMYRAGPSRSSSCRQRCRGASTSCWGKAARLCSWAQSTRTRSFGACHRRFPKKEQLS